jgi:hypothetical protein
MADINESSGRWHVVIAAMRWARRLKSAQHGEHMSRACRPGWVLYRARLSQAMERGLGGLVPPQRSGDILRERLKGMYDGKSAIDGHCRQH